MSVYVTDFKPGPAGQWTVLHDDAPGGAHSGTINATSVGYARKLDGSDNHQSAIIDCPVCGASSAHPIGGGAQPASVQEMFVRLIVRLGCPCGTNFTPGRPFLLARAHAKVHTENQDFIGRWQMNPAVTS